MILPLTLVCLLGLFVAQEATPNLTPDKPPAPFVAENDDGRAITIENGVMRIRKSGGWIRTRQFVSNFVLDTEFRLDAPDSEGAVGVRSLHAEGEWPRRGLRVVLSARAPSGTLQASSYRSIRRSGTGPLRIAPDEWHRLRVAGEGTTIEVTIDGTVTGVYEVDVFAGALAFEARNGAVEFRSLHIKTAPIPEHVVRHADIGKLGIGPVGVRYERKPSYSRAAMERKIAGVVLFETVVRPDGGSGAVTIMKFLDPGLEHEALAALCHWKFTPALRDGKPIEVLVEIEMSFILK